jgi:hypothetical protein
LPGGQGAFVGDYGGNSNGDIAVYCNTGLAVNQITKKLKAVGLRKKIDFVILNTIEVEMWRMIHSEQIEQPFWFKTGADWLRCKLWQGRVLVWYDR